MRRFVRAWICHWNGLSSVWACPQTLNMRWVISFWPHFAVFFFKSLLKHLSILAWFWIQDTNVTDMHHCEHVCVLYFFFQIEVGSTNIRVGSTIFGTREYPNTPSPSPEKKPEVPSEEAAKKMQRLTVKDH